ncbi:MAG: histone deacetylase [Nocardioides sp.]|nr:histone deacetylase [Nocardioidaceae bacterium]MCB8955113.1 histone deacetylase [Nocardioides sp.]
MSHVWYVSYGSNMSAARLGCYLEGGCPPGGSRHNPGARDRTPPTRSVPVDLPGTTYFAGESPQWGGGVAFYDHETPGFTAARGYLLTAGQLADVAAQEMYRVPAPDDPVEQIALDRSLRSPGAGLRHELGPGRYETLVEVGRYDGVPLLTFTAPHGAEHVEHTRPAPAYLEAMATGLREARGWDEEQVAAYFAAVLRAA